MIRASTQMPGTNKPAPLSRVFLLDKPAGLSSFAALGALKRAIGSRKVGHAGTLDPFATGLLIAASGKLTRAAGTLSGLDKEYRAVFTLGRETDTLDTEGHTVAEAPVPEFSTIQSKAENFLGVVDQIPPAFSAVKIKGKRAYAMSRKGDEPEMPSRQVRIDRFRILDWSPPLLTVDIACSKGTYIRSLARDLALACGSRGFCSELRRTAIGPFRVENAMNAEKIDPDAAYTAVEFFKAIGVPLIECDENTAESLRSGIPFHRLEHLGNVEAPQILFVGADGRPAALAELRDRRLSYRIVFDDC